MISPAGVTFRQPVISLCILQLGLAQQQVCAAYVCNTSMAVVMHFNSAHKPLPCNLFVCLALCQGYACIGLHQLEPQADILGPFIALQVGP
jgi:hypothetical protein